MEQIKGLQEAPARNILIVDDDPDTCEILDLLFRVRGYTTRVVNNGTEAVQYVQAGEPDAVVLDVMMPEMDGWETLQRMRLHSNVPVLFLTALTSGDYTARAFSLGVNDYIRKPFHTAELLARLEVLFTNDRYPAIPSHFGTSKLQRPTVSVVIPTLDEADNLPLVLPHLPMDWIDEVFLVDGCSTDRTVEVAQKLMPSINVVLEPQVGKGAALRAGYQRCSGDIIMVMDADGSHDPREIPRFVKALMHGSDFVKGSRFAPGGGTTDMPRLRQFGNRFFVSLVNLLFNVHFTDLCYGYHAFWRYCLDSIHLNGVEGFEIDTAIYVRALCQRLRLTEVPSFEGYRFRGVGKLRTFPDGLRVLKTILREAFRNLRSSRKVFYEGFRSQTPDGIRWLVPLEEKKNLYKQ
jgi:CheY-like chemotaxis protein/glycosyltransferase involved in cell wall biosynthesis